ncbi:aldehyde dehydrogenase (NADP(+)) [Cryptosporangium aurantiacum]|uniref:NADP-dependent aldehyde dehydrogenase n=1 Tax=Cryptosporangium aurantiacum TaxID=134849 RepID=A0A1M7Q3W7_9ACTN|nr:aldehyde dehydrogenase (NADP(+)) [Cryptosporangium aurantiacum]SHN25040.1 NADP-dependent aldehyde dehydrogenase [Cryptosporangium aurantiacum]
MTDVPSIDPRTGDVAEIVAAETTTAEVAALCRVADAASRPLEDLGRDGRAALLDALAAALEDAATEVVALADRETALGTTRLTGELARTCYQLRLFGEVLREGGYLEATIDHPADTPMGPRPDLRRMLVPIGPVAVFGASNFPLAFSVPGGDTASALAAGCPVVVKAHGSHPATSQRCYEVLAGAAEQFGAPPGTLGIVHGQQAGADLVAHPLVRAVGFTGSTAGARALLAIIEKRADPIPFYGELSSLNPLVVTRAAAADRAADIGAGFVASFTLGGGQFCTKPGLAFVPTGPDGDALVEAARRAVAALDPVVLLNERIAESYAAGAARLAQAPGVSVVRTGTMRAGGVPVLLTTSARALPPEVVEECFGPIAVLARYRDDAELRTAIERLPSSLTATVHRGPGETELPDALAGWLRPRAGRLVFDGYPTGVAVSWAQHHGGPWPATNTQHTSVGTAAIRRFLRPFTWQNAPQEVLPAELRDAYGAIPRRINGTLHPTA